MKRFYRRRPNSEDLFGLQLHGCDVLFGKLQRNFCFMSLCMCWALLRANLHISVFRASKTHPKVAMVSPDTKALAILGKNQKGCFLCVFFFHEWQNLELLRGYPYFQSALLILMIFYNKFSRAVTVGMYDCLALLWPWMLSRSLKVLLTGKAQWVVSPSNCWR